MNADAISQVTKAMRLRLEAALAAAGDTGTIFVGPLDDPLAGSGSLILFLYRIIPSANLRNREHRVVSAGPPPQTLIFPNSFPLDLYYLVTLGTRTAMMTEETLLHTLGFAIREFHLDPELSGVNVGHEVIHVSFEPLTTDEASRIWQLFPTANYRTSVSYVVTPVWIDPPTLPPMAAPVIQDSLASGALRTETHA